MDNSAGAEGPRTVGAYDKEQGNVQFVGLL